jgi:hypothetical protein
VSNESVPPSAPQPTLLEDLGSARVEDEPKPPLVLLGGDEDLVCVDDTCLPGDVVR